MSELEEKQADCPYCHEPFEIWGNVDEDGDYTGNLAMINLTKKRLSINHDDWDYYNDEPCTSHVSLPIKCCPMCGRKLGEDE